MAGTRDSLAAQATARIPSPRHQETASQGVKKTSDGRQPGERHDSHSVNENQSPPLPPQSQKRLRELKDPTSHGPIERPQKRRRRSPCGPSCNQTFDQGTANSLSASQQSHISHWAEQSTWPKEYFQEDSMYHLLARQKSSASLRRKRSETSLSPSATPSDQRPREEKIAPYRNAAYSTLLETLGNSYMSESRLGITDASKALHEDLLTMECTTPKETLFSENVFDTACRNLLDKNEARIILDFARLLAPSPESLSAFGATDLEVLVESVNEGWNNSIPITNPRPQPDFAVGFRRSMFSDVQLSKIQPFLGDISSLSYFRATYYMFFPFLTCEVKCGATGLDIADRQNAHSMTLAVRGIVELFRLGGKEKELHRELLTFSISHDHRTVRLYGYYPVLDGPKMKIHRRQIHTFDITARNGKERWTTYKFTVAVYHHSITLLRKIQSLVDDLPPDFALQLSQQPESQLSEPSGFSQLSEPSGLSQPFEEQVLTEMPNFQQNPLDLQQTTPITSTQENSASRKKQRHNV
ncbi:Hypothetical protein R9X50_00189600 [Acrodontium crateriforme]|uniref:DUF7924 domain-containing protein n=1 Tax=Acrodontium crateriforme TaxID=150365 RepID=A0AAQ3M0H8_9PEZI|nr:Hypothetical protein R9X50_00189600 [Acrodontium crateriforme]